MSVEPKVVCIFNPYAGMGRFKVDEAELLRRVRERSSALKKSIDLEVWETERNGDARFMARKGALEGADVIAAAGGDGTVSEVVNGLAGTDVPLCILPTGSGNDTITSLGGERGLRGCIDDLLRGDIYEMDLGRMNGTYFINVVGIGLDAEVNHKVASSRKMVKRIGPTLHYIACAVSVILKWSDLGMRISVDGGKPRDITGKMVTIGNGTTCGGGFRLTPRARMNDGILDLSVIGHTGKLKALTYLPKAFKGSHLGIKEVEYLRFRRLFIEGVEEKLPYHLDGEGGYSKIFDIEISERILSTVHPVHPGQRGPRGS